MPLDPPLNASPSLGSIHFINSAPGKISFRRLCIGWGECCSLMIKTDSISTQHTTVVNTYYWERWGQTDLPTNDLPSCVTDSDRYFPIGGLQSLLCYIPVHGNTARPSQHELLIAIDQVSVRIYRLWSAYRQCIQPAVHASQTDASSDVRLFVPIRRLHSPHPFRRVSI